MIKIERAIAIFFLVCGFFSTRAFAEEDVLGSRTLAIGNTGRSQGGPGAVFLNPAAISLQTAYTAEALYRMLLYDSSHAFGLSIIDTKTSIVGAGLSYSYINSKPGGETREGHTARLSLSVPLYQKYLFLGAGVKYLYFEYSDKSTLNGATMDAGIVFRLFNMLSVGVVGHNLINIGSKYEAPISLGTGIAFQTMTLTIAFDFVTDFKTNETTSFKYLFGAEYLLLTKVPLRIGYILDRVNYLQYITFGVGFVSSNFGFDISAAISPDNAQNYILIFGIKIFV